MVKEDTITSGASYSDATHPDDIRARIILAAAELIAAGGREAATTRAVATAAMVQAPTIYRLFGDKHGLLDAVAEHGLATYVADKSGRQPHPDPVQDLRNGWDTHIAFGLAHPALFAIMSVDPRQGQSSPAVAAGLKVLRMRVKNIALAGRLRVSEERAVALLQSVGTGTVLTLLRTPEQQRDQGFSAAAREAVLAAISGDAIEIADGGVRSAAATLRARLDQAAVLTPGERHLLEEILDRIADSG